MRFQGVCSCFLVTTVGPAALYTGEKGVRPPAVVGHRMLPGVSVAMMLLRPSGPRTRDAAVSLDVVLMSLSS